MNRPNERALKEKVMLKSLRIGALLGLSILLAACPTTSVRPPVDAKAGPAAIGAPDLQGATLYSVNPTASDVQIHVFRAGTLARLGHNHVMTSKHVTGRMWWQSAVERSGFELEFPVAELIVDDAQARAAAGGEFPGEISQSDRDGTRKNMLRAEVLDSDKHPKISLRSVRIAGSPTNPQITTRITIKGVARDVATPATVAVQGNRLIATGSFDIQQTDFGMKPFSIGLGALEVQDRLTIVFKVVADKK
jgi:polyisoprenoid-binding protein YceI